MSVIISNTPLPVPPMARAMPTSSASLAVRVGVGRPSAERWATVREVLKLRGMVAWRAPGTLPNDGKVIEDARRYS